MKLHNGLIIVSILLLSISCATPSPKNESLMTTPEILDDISHIPYDGYSGDISSEHVAVLFATARIPAPPEEEVAFQNERDTLLHLGKAYVTVVNKDLDWDDLRQAPEERDTQKNYTLGVSETEVFGPLDDANHEFVDPARIPEDPEAPARRFAAEVNARLAGNPVQEIVLYVHGVNSSFEAPLIYAAELTHFLGYRQVPIAFSWASGQNILKYVSDVDSAEYSAVQFRVFLGFLLNETNAEKINIIAHSAGTKLVSQALHQIALLDANDGYELITDKIGDVFLIAGDIERNLFWMYMADGLLNSVERTTVYLSDSDGALNTSASIHKFERLGQSWDENQISDTEIRAIEEKNIEFIDITGLTGTKKDLGHSYFKTSPWVSSDLLASLAIHLTPKERGLEYNGNLGFWTFPEDYISRLKQGIEKARQERD